MLIPVVHEAFIYFQVLRPFATAMFISGIWHMQTPVPPTVLQIPATKLSGLVIVRDAVRSMQTEAGEQFDSVDFLVFILTVYEFAWVLRT